MICSLLVLVAAAAVAASPAAPDSGLAAAAVADTVRFVVVDGDTLPLTPTLEVVGSRVPVALPGVVRGVDLLDAADLSRLPGRSVAEQLQAVPAVVTGQRQQYGVQSDLSIRGSTFDQVQVLLDGFDVADPQTGHHLMNLPLGVHDVGRLEVLPGHGSALYGSGAFGGTVNVVAKRPADRSGGELGVLGGGNGTWSGWGSLDLVGRGGDTGARVSAERFKTAGYDFVRDDGTPVTGGNDADTWTATGRFVAASAKGESDLFVGYGSRAFGAYDFYAPYPSWERTRNFTATARVNRRLGERLTVEPRLSFRRHEDRFVLIRSNPDAYTNDHVTRRVAGELRTLVELGRGHGLAVGAEGVYEDIASRGVRGGQGAAALGDHLRRRVSVSAELDRHGAPLRWQLGGRLDARSSLAPHASGTAALSYDVHGPWTVRTSLGSIHRVPTFTDLYYEDPANRGNPDLKPEKGWAWDAGIEMAQDRWRGSVVYFERHETDLIDWARAAGATLWQVLNVADGRARGVETRLAWEAPRGHRVTAGWAWLERETSLTPGYEAKYALLAPRHNLTAAGTVVLPAGLAATVAVRYLERNDGPDDFRVAAVLDARLDWRSADGWFVAIIGTNLTDRRTMEVPGVPMPGTLMTGTLGHNF
jgi:iron complex outermembrane receptor protein